MEIRKTTLSAETLFKRTTAQAQTESAIPLPQGKTLERVLSNESEAVIREVACRDGAVVVTGTMTVRPTVESTEHTPYAFEASADFTHTIRMDGVTPDMNARVRVEIPACSLKNEDGGLRMQATAELCTTVLEPKQISCITDIDGTSGLERLIETVTLKRRALLGAKSAHINESVNAPQGAAVLKANAAPQIGGMLLGMDGMRIDGALKLSILYLLPDGGIRRECASVPFSDTVPCEADENAAASVSVKSLSVVAEEDGTATVDATLSIGVCGCVTDTQRVLSDAYDETGSFLCKTETATVQNYEAAYFETAQLSETLTVPAHMKDAYQPLYACIRTAITDTSVENGRGRIEGIMAVTVVYRDDDGSKQSFTQELPLSFDTEAKGDVLLPRIRVLDYALTGGGRTVGLNVTLCIEAEWYRSVTFRFVPELLPAPERENDSGMLVWFTDPDETVFSIGKRFGLPIQRVRACNPNLCEPIREGTPVLIFRNR